MNHYKEIETLIENYEVNKKVREYKDNSEVLLTNWNIGRLLVEAQGGEARAKYGDSLIKKWGIDLSNKYGKNYSSRNLRKMRQLYIFYSFWPTVSAKLSWSHYVEIISLKNENERNYYLNQAILNNLSTRELESLIKSKTYDRLSYKDKNNIKLIDNSSSNLTIEDMIKDPIILYVNYIDKNIKEVNNNKTIGILIVKKNNKLVIEYTTNNDIYVTTYKLKITQ